MQQSIAVLGAGSWGTALALRLAANGHGVRLWDYSAAHIAQLAQERENRRYLPGIALPDKIKPCATQAEALVGADILLLVVPSHAFAQVLEQVRHLLGPDTLVSWATKGFQPATGQLLSQVASQFLGERPLAAISGPTFATEVAKGLPTAITLASLDAQQAATLARALHGESFRVYTSSDLIGVQVGGAVKNVMAIAAGIADGLGFGANTRAALITRGLAEIGRLATAMGGQTETLMGLAGLGDLVLTCTDNQSRNRRMGLALAAGKSQQQARDEIGQEVEGVGTALEVQGLARRMGVEMPISEQVYQVLHQGLSPQQAVENLLGRKPKAEAGS